MTEADIKNYIKDNLNLEIDLDWFNEKITVKLLLDGETFVTANLDVPPRWNEPASSGWQSSGYC